MRRRCDKSVRSPDPARGGLTIPGMHRFRLVLCAADSVVARAARALEESGGLPVGPREPSCWVWATEEGLEAVEEFSRVHDVLVCFEGFRDFEDEIVTGMVAAEETTIHGRRSVLPRHWGSVHDEDGQSLDPALLEWAGATIAGSRDQPGNSTLSSGLETALVIGEEIGRFTADTRDFLAREAPTARSLDAIVRLAQLGLRISAAGASRTRGELSYLLPLRLTQAVVHARIDESRETPGNADWQWWLGVVLTSAADLIDDEHYWDITPAGPDPELVPGAEARDAGKTMELAAQSLVTSCVQALTLFGSPRAGL
jgi:hypothetical protein